jgi:hypothetical protein
VLSNTEEDKDTSWEYCKVLSIAKKKEMITAQIITVWWVGMISIRINHG